MTLQAYQGHFENGLFYSAGQNIRIPERKKIIVTILEDSTNDATLEEILAESHRESILNGTSEMTLDEINDIIAECRQ